MTRMLAGRTVLVTGASRGIGRATAVAAHREGASVVLHYGSARVEAESDRGAARIPRPSRAGRPHRRRRRAPCLGRSRRLTGLVDVLVNNAGAWLPSDLDDTPRWREGWKANLALNLTAPADLCRAAIQHFRSTGGGVIVNVASRSAHRGDDLNHLAYGAAKGGLLALTKGIARGCAAEGVLASPSPRDGWPPTSPTTHRRATQRPGIFRWASSPRPRTWPK